MKIILVYPPPPPKKKDTQQNREKHKYWTILVHNLGTIYTGSRVNGHEELNIRLPLQSSEGWCKDSEGGGSAKTSACCES